ncbi:MAG: divalent-cation tolerance protein CutA [Candidatus Methanoliparum thermophilum]|uniref:Divalent-cation tolerance protein CutA n=1 Tax=Methanoliparum thermophilum TaxID=2491083 RepID=A0A520KQN3_METT2|nr:divalent-cation tolerance protein CutA [Candidatus Methanoliparum sp. LAM-1]RZN63871.1 MAG: divalent-cation tolerance protein CutA [Candidatus Methanoliparum thermophilum]BDC36399.1 dihydroorotate dehydrogenase [Candidatus Methanoliparum sp. LAM-1]
MEKYIQVITTVESKRDAERIANVLVEKNLAGCVQILGPIESVYWWENRIERTEEWLCVIKSEQSIYDEVEKTIKENHPYEIPEILAIPVIKGDKNYLEWLSKELKK